MPCPADTEKQSVFILAGPSSRSLARWLPNAGKYSILLTGCQDDNAPQAQILSYIKILLTFIDQYAYYEHIWIN